MRDAVACYCGAALRFREYKRPLQDCLNVKGKAERIHFRDVVFINCRLDVSGQPLCICRDAGIACGANGRAAVIAFLHYGAHETGKIFHRSIEHGQAKIDVTDQPVERIIYADPAGLSEDPLFCDVGPCSCSGDGQSLLGCEVVEESAFGNSSRLTNFVDRRCSETLKSNRCDGSNNKLIARADFRSLKSSIRFHCKNIPTGWYVSIVFRSGIASRPNREICCLDSHICAAC